MLRNVLGNTSSSDDNANKIDTFVFVQKFFLRANFIETILEEDIDLTNQYRIKNVPCLAENSDAAFKFYVYSGLNDPSLIPNTMHVDFNDTNLENVRFSKVTLMPAVPENFTAKSYVDNGI